MCSLQNLTALNVLGALDVKVVKFGAALLRCFCRPIITAGKPSEIFTYHGVTAVVNAKREYRIKAHKNENKGNKGGTKVTASPEAVFE